MAPPTFPTSYDPNHPNEAIVPLPNTPLLPLKSASTSYSLSYQAPLSLRGSGPGLIIFNPPKPTNHVDKAETLDPEPFFKWAEEGYGILLVDDLKKDATKEAIDEAIKALDGQEKITNKEKYAVFGELLLFTLLAADMRLKPAIIPDLLLTILALPFSLYPPCEFLCVMSKCSPMRLA
jgi:carboxymethylenebutenolidase